MQVTGPKHLSHLLVGVSLVSGRGLERAHLRPVPTEHFAFNAGQWNRQDGVALAGAGGADHPGEIFVTARRRSERLQDVPIAVTPLSGATFASRRIASAEALRFVAPALQVWPTAFDKAVPGYTIRSQRSLESLVTQDPRLASISPNAVGNARMGPIRRSMISGFMTICASVAPC